MEAPFMTDANYESSSNITVKLEQNDSGYKLILMPDVNWLKDSNRQYPVTIDPPIKTSLDVNSIKDTLISQKVSYGNYYTFPDLGVGTDSDKGVMRSYIKFDLPALSSGDIVTDARLYLNMLTANTNTRQINVHKVNSNWESHSIIWSNAPGYNPKIEDYQLVNSSNATNYSWNVTSIVKDWYNTGNNYGLMIKSNDENIDFNKFHSSDTSNAALRPQIVFNYVNNSGLESYWTYHSQDVKRAGTGYINDYNGNLVFQHEDFSMNGNKMPAVIKHVYNTNYKSNDKVDGNPNALNEIFGFGWRLNLSQRINPITLADGVTYYKYIDEDGTQHYFYYDSATSSYKDESGLNLKLTLNYNNGIDNGFCITDNKDNKIIFLANGLLYKLIDNNNNALTLSYNGLLLTKVTDGAGRETLFDINAEGILLGVIDSSGRRTSYSYSGTQLTTITYPDGKQTKYTYDSNNNLLSALNYDGYKISYTYSGGKVHRVIKTVESHIDGTLGGETSIDYNNEKANIFTDVKGRKDLYQFNNWGNTVSITDSQGNAKYTEYKEQSKDPNKNKTSFDSKVQKTTVNYIKNHGLEYGDYWGFANDSSSSGDGGYSTETTYFGQRSVKVIKNNTTSRSYFEQSLVLEKGKTYTYSGYIRTVNVSNTSGNGAHLLVHYKNNAGQWCESYSKKVSGTKDWERQEVTFTIPADATSGDIIVRAAIANESGSAYFDCMQLEEGLVANRYNLVENGDFRGGSGQYWNGSSCCDGNDTVSVNPTPNVAGSNIDNYSCRLIGSATLMKGISQTINISGSAGDSFVFSGWAKADSVPISTGRYFALDIGVQGLDGNYQWLVVPFNQGTTDWQYVSSVIKTDRAYKSISVNGLYYNNSNTAYFDGFRLYKEEFGESYSYDANGNLNSVSDIAKQNSTFAYNTKNDLVASTDAKGNQFKYDYDAKHNITKATSAENVVYSFTYDASGNPLTAKIGDSSLFINSSATYTASGNYLNSLTDSLGNTVTNSWNEQKGLLNSVTDAKGKTTNYTYDEMDRLKTVSKNADGKTISNSYGYENDRIKSITQNGFNYNFGYDSLGNNKSVSVGTQNLITNNFEPRTSNLLQSTYGNGQVVGRDYDNLDRVTAKKYNGNITNTYEYDSSGNLGLKNDLINGVTYKYTYDTADRPVKEKDSNGNTFSFSYDANNNLSKVTDSINGANYETNFGYDKDNRTKSVQYSRNSANTILFGYDTIGRLTNKKINTSSANYNTSYVYDANTKNDFTRVTYQGHMQNYGWQEWAYDGATTGMTGLNLRMEAFNLKLENAPAGVRIKYQAHVQNIGWQNWVYDGATAGTVGQNLRLEAFKVVLENAPAGYHIQYRAHVQNLGWQAWVTDGALAGTEGQALRVEAIQVQLIKSDNTTCTTSIQSINNNGSKISYSYDKNGNIETIKKDKNLMFENDFPSMGRRDFSGTHPELIEEYVIQGGAPCTVTSSATTKKLKRNTTYTLSFDAISWYGVEQNFHVDLFPDSLPEAVFRTELNAVKHYVWTFTTPDTPEVENCNVRFFQIDNNVQPISFCKVVLTEGDKEANLAYSDDFPIHNITNFSGTHPEMVDEYKIQGGAPCTVTSSATTKKLKRNTTYTVSFDAISWYGVEQNFHVDLFPDSLPEAVFRTELNAVKHYVWTFTTPDLPEVENCHLRFFQIDNNVQPVAFCNVIFTEGAAEGQNKLTRYYYNELNEVIRENNEELNKTITYAYDAGGNITNKTEYAYTQGALGTATKTYAYAYGDTNWKDKLTSFDGKAITYDAIGNPLTYNGWNFAWEQGRQLQGITGNGKTISYKYNDAGIRTSKTVNGVTTNYRLLGDKVTYETNGTDKIYYTYDSNNDLVSMSLNGVEYYYIRNGQGDIIGLIDKNGAQVVGYSYDTWGNLISIDGSLKDSVGVKNPYRYRGYRYDTETGLYYLQSRYYNAEWGRFINADGITGEVGELLSHNMFAYCNNDPVNMEDPDGDIAWWIGAAVTGALVDSAIYLYQNRNGGFTWSGLGKTAAKGALTGVAFGGVGKFVAKGARAVVSARKAKAVTKVACFTEDTLVLTQGGSKPIKYIKVGDEVYSENPETGEKGLQKVTNVFINETNKLIHVYIDGEEIKTTSEHPFWVVDEGWVGAEDLRPADKVLLYSGKIGDVEQVTVEELDELIKVYNFEVEDRHTYFVSEKNILVHNACSQSTRITAKMTTETAEKLGFKKTNFFSKGQPIFKKGNRYITPDVDSHNGGSWKMADSVKNLGNKKTRMGTYNGNLVRIGD